MTLQNLLGDIALDASIQTLIARNPINSNGAPYVSSAREKFRDAFLTFDTTNNWTAPVTGAGMTITTAGTTGGARYLNIASGTTANSETSFLSRTLFRAPCTVIVGASLSQRIANQDFFIELVEVDASGNVITDTTQPSARFKDARNGASFQFNGTVVATQTVNVRQDGLSEVTATGTYGSTAATGTGPNFIPSSLFEITLRTRDVQFQSSSPDTSALKTAPLARTMRVPNPDALYALRIRVLNGAVAPASTTDFRVHSVVILDDTRITVDFGSIAGVSNFNNSLPVAVTNSISLAGSLAAGTNAIGDVGVQYRGTVTGAATRAKLLSAATTNPTVVKASAGRLLGWSLANTTASWVYVKLHNIATTPTAGTTAVVEAIGIPPNGKTEYAMEGGIAFSTGIAFTTTTGAADADTTSVAANAIVGTLYFA